MTTLIPKYDQGETGAVNRPINIKFAESISILDFGADPTGVADSSTAFTNAVATGKSIYIPKGTYSVNVQLSLVKGQRIYGEGRNLTVIVAPDAFAGSLFILQQGCEIYDMTLTRVTTGVYNANGVAIQVDFVANDAWNTVVKNVLFISWNYADNITNYRHIREGNMYFYCNYGTVIGYDPTQSAGTVLINGCAYLYTGEIGIWSRSTSTHSQVKATTFEFAKTHIVCDGVLYVDSCYIADFGAYLVTGTGRIYIDNGGVTPFIAGANNNGADYGLNFITTDNEYAVKVSNAIIQNSTIGVQYQFIGGQIRRGAVLGAGVYTLQNCYFINNTATGTEPSGYKALYPLEYSSTINQQIMENSTNLPNYVTNGTFLNRTAVISSFTSAAIRNPWGGDTKVVPAATTTCDIAFSLPAEYTLNDPLLLMVYVGVVSGGFIKVDFSASTNITADDTNFQQLIQYSSKLSANNYSLNSGFTYGTTNNFALNSFIVTASATTGTIRLSSSGGGTGQIAAIILTPIANDPNLGRPIAWFYN
jgi:hypothetical protein